MSEAKIQPGERPAISVCIATYNGGRFLKRQIESILPQLTPGDEIIISDDSSQDDTIQVIEELRDRRIRLYQGQTFRSATYNFENALSYAKGQVVFLCDQDDEWVEGWVERAIRELETVDLVVCNAFLIDADGKHFSDLQTVFGSQPRAGVWRNLYRNRYIGCCCAFRRRVLDVALPFPKRLPWHDWWIGLIADSCFTTRFIPSKMVRYRRHGENASPTGGKSPYSLSKKIRMRWNIGVPLAWRWILVELGLIP